MEVKKYIDALEGVKKALLNKPFIAQRVNAVAGNLLLGTVKKRIFLQGLNTNMSPIGTYSTKPYYQPLNSRVLVALPKGSKNKPKLVGRGDFVTPKDNKVRARRLKPTFLNGNKRKSMYMPNGYKEFRELVGRQGGNVKGSISTTGVNLNLTGSLSRGYTMAIYDDKIVLGFPNQELRHIASGLEKKYGSNIFAASNKEIEIFTRHANIEVERIINEIIKQVYGSV